MEVGGLKRSEISFRRQGSSGLVWADKLLAGDLNKMLPPHEQDGKEKVDLRELRPSRSVGSTGTLQGRQSPKEQTTYRTVKVSSPNVDPPSPKVSGCGFCSIFGKPQAPPATRNKPKARKR